ncbi:MAG: hypothetical protein J0M12_10725, partial [Deltaproteobacteria bacterium]|nr:hypothetical protein [Deltaproteobacteria bacterium]
MPPTSVSSGSPQQSDTPQALDVTSSVGGDAPISLGAPLDVRVRELLRVITSEVEGRHSVSYRASDVDPERLESSFAMAKRAAAELLHGLVATQGDHPGVVICGGARLKMEDPRHREDCELAIRAGESVAREGFSVHTGGGMGVMHYAAVGGR